MKNILIIVLAVVSLVSCRLDRETDDALKCADIMIYQNPDSALTILSGIDMSNCTQRTRAHHALLYSKALDKSGIFITNDSIIKVAEDYFKGSGDSLEYQSLFYKGVVLSSGSKFDRALIPLMTAADLALAKGDFYYHGLATRELAEIYSRMLAFPGQIENAKAAIESFEKSGHGLHEAFERVSLANGYASSGYPDSAIAELEKVKLFERFDSIAELQTAYYRNLDIALAGKGLYQAACDTFAVVEARGVKFDSDDYLRVGLHYMATGDTHSARKALEKALEINHDADINYYTSYLRFRLADAENDAADALKALKIFVKRSNKRTRSILANPYYNVVNDYYRSKLEFEKQTNSYIIYVSVAVGVILVLVIVIVVILLRLNAKKLQLKVAEADELYLTVSRLDSDIRELDERVADRDRKLHEDEELQSRLFDNMLQRFEALDRLCYVWTSLPDKVKQSDNYAKRIGTELSRLTDSDMLATLETMIDRAYDKRMSRFRELYAGSLNDAQMTLALLTFADFSNATISAILDRDTNYVNVNRHRIREVLRRDDRPEAKEFKELFKC